MGGKKRSGGDRLGKLVQRTKPAAAVKGNKPAGQFGKRAASNSAAKAPELSDEERMLRAILAMRD